MKHPLSDAINDIISKRTQILVDTVKEWTDNFNVLTDRIKKEGDENLSEYDELTLKRGVRTGNIVHFYQIYREQYNNSNMTFDDLENYCNKLKSIMDDNNIDDINQ